MHFDRHFARKSLIVAFCLLNIGFGYYAGVMPLAAGGLAGLCYVALLLSQRGEPA